MHLHTASRRTASNLIPGTCRPKQVGGGDTAGGVNNDDVPAATAAVQNKPPFPTPGKAGSSSGNQRPITEEKRCLMESLSSTILQEKPGIKVSVCVLTGCRHGVHVTARAQPSCT